MPGSERGILGVKKDPKNPLIFSFRKGGEEWPSSDSGDSDYDPGSSEDEEGIKKSKRAKKQPRKKKTKTAKTELKEEKILSDEGFASEGSQDNSDDLWGQRIPPEVLLKIFRSYVDQHEALPFLCRASQVCKLWNTTSQDHSLWERLDLSYGWIKSTDKTLIWLCSNRGSRIKEVNVQTWKNLTSSALQAVAEFCPLLEYININYCTKINSQGLKFLLDACQHLSSIELAFMGMDIVSAQSLRNLIESRKSNLKLLNLSGNTLTGFNSILSNHIAMLCPNLESLDLSNCIFSVDFVTLPIEKLQTGCRKLKILRLTNSKFRAAKVSIKTQAEAAGFPELEELSVAIHPDGPNNGIGMDDNFLHRILKLSANLKKLDIRGSTHMGMDGLQQLSITDLTHLYLSQSSIARYEGIEVIMRKWQHSLEELDLSWNMYPGMSLDLAMNKLSDDPSKSRLKTLDLSGTCISCASLKSLLEGCPNLTSINLSSCRGLQRGMKREYFGTYLARLREEINSLVEQETSEHG